LGERLEASCISGFGSPAFFSSRSVPFAWEVCMWRSSNGSSREGFRMCFSKDMVESMGPYSCWLSSMCCAYADWGLLSRM
jgi:hypothetical protein